MTPSRELSPAGRDRPRQWVSAHSTPRQVALRWRIAPAVAEGQDAENQLRELRQFVANKASEDWTLAGEYLDRR